MSFATLFDAGERVGIGSPGYPSYRQILKAQNLVPVDIETKLKNKYQPTLSHPSGHCWHHVYRDVSVLHLRWQSRLPGPT